MENNCGIVLLAAGASSRLGTAKQLLLYKENTLLQHSIAVALSSMASQVIVVLGAHAANIQPGIQDKKLSFIINQQWQEGMSSSICCGLNHLLKIAPQTASVIFMVCDQPFVSAELLNQLITLQKQTGHTIVASKYADTTGIPAIFSKKIFPDLLQLKGDAGAKKLIKQEDNIATVSFPLGNIDIDTAADYRILQEM